MFGTAHALCFAPAPCAGDPFSLPHVWLKFFVYTYKFTFDYRIITTQMSFLYALWCHLFRRFPTLAEYLRWYPTPSDHDPSLVLRYFRFPFDYPSPPIRRLLEQWWPKWPPMLLAELLLLLLFFLKPIELIFDVTLPPSSSWLSELPNIT